VPVQKLAFKVSAGKGELMLDEEANHVRFPRTILANAGVAPQNARLMDAFGESMRPTINDGDTLLVDVSPQAMQIVEGKIYVFSIGDDAFVKRLRRIGDQVLMISDNREMFPDSSVPKDSPLRIYGRVKWAGRSL
jgi:phage repressor protein C with HTH and peptisase S24 domain